MDYGKYIDMAVQNPHGKEMIRLIQQPENFSRLVSNVGGLVSNKLKNLNKVDIDPLAYRLEEKAREAESGCVEVRAGEYAMKVLYAAMWAFGVNRVTLRNKRYWRVHPLRTIKSPWGCIPMEIYMLDAYLENVIKPQCPW